MAMLHVEQKQMLVRTVGPQTTRGAECAGLRVLSKVCTVSKSAPSLMDWTEG